MATIEVINAPSPSPPHPLRLRPLDLVYGTANLDSSKSIQLHTAMTMGYRILDIGNNDPYDEAAAGAILSSEFSNEAERRETSHSPASAERASSKFNRNQVLVQAKYSPSVLFSKKQPPYDPNDAVSLQVLKSFQATLRNLRVSCVDVYFLHRPLISIGQTFAAWEVMEEIVRRGGARCLGISQVGIELLQALVQMADVPPRVVQNYCCSANGYDREVRAYFRDSGIVYQAFGLLREMTSPGRREERPGCVMGSQLTALLVAAREGGEQFHVLDGSRNITHMEENLKAAEIAQAGVKEQSRTRVERFSL